MYVLVAPHLVLLNLLCLGLSTRPQTFFHWGELSGDPLHALVGPGCTLWLTPPLPAHIEQKSECTQLTQTAPPWRPPLAVTGSAALALMPKISGLRSSARCVAWPYAWSARHCPFRAPLPSLQSRASCWGRQRWQRRSLPPKILFRPCILLESS